MAHDTTRGCSDEAKMEACHTWDVHAAAANRREPAAMSNIHAPLASVIGILNNSTAISRRAFD